MPLRFPEPNAFRAPQINIDTQTVPYMDFASSMANAMQARTQRDTAEFERRKYEEALALKRQQDAAMAAYLQNPDDPAARNAFIQQSPGGYLNYGKTQAEIAYKGQQAQTEKAKGNKYGSESRKIERELSDKDAMDMARMGLEIMGQIDSSPDPVAAWNQAHQQYGGVFGDVDGDGVSDLPMFEDIDQYRTGSAQYRKMLESILARGGGNEPKFQTQIDTPNGPQQVIVTKDGRMVPVGKSYVPETEAVRTTRALEADPGLKGTYIETKKPAGSQRPVQIHDPNSPSGSKWVTPQEAVGKAAPQAAGQRLTPALEQKVKGKLNTIQLLRSQLQKVKDNWTNLKNTAAAGPLQGLAPTDVGKQFDANLDQMQSFIRQLTRTPGEGAMSDYESRLAQSVLPRRTEFEASIQEKISGLEDIINTIDSGYSEMLGAAPGAASPGMDQRSKVRELMNQGKSLAEAVAIVKGGR